MADTSIEWTDVTWNPVAGCTVLSPGCTNCYAMRLAARLEAMGTPKYQGLTRRTGGRAKWNGIVRTDEAALVAPLHWTKPRMVFVNSMSDLFHAAVPEEFIGRVWDVMARASKHTFQILTKRPKRMAEISQHFPLLSNVWLGTSVESADYLCRLDDLRRARAHVSFVSFEPLLSSVGRPDLNGIDWAIVGGELVPKQGKCTEIGSKIFRPRAARTTRHFSSSNGAAVIRRRQAECSAARLGTNSLSLPAKQKPGNFQRRANRSR